MYNQVNHGPHFGQGPHPTMPPTYQQAPHPPPSHVQQGPPSAPSVQCVPTSVPPNIGARLYLHGPPATSSAVPVSPPIQVPSGVIQNTGQSYAIPSPLLRGNSTTPQTFSRLGQNSQLSSNLGVQTHHVPPPVPPPPVGHSRQDTSWAPGPPTRVLPPPPPLPSSSQGQVLYKPPFHPCPPQLGDMQSLQHNYNPPPPPPPPPPSGSGYTASTPDGVYLHSTVGNYQVPSVTPPPLPSSPPPIPPSPPPLTPPTTSTSFHTVHLDPKSGKVSGIELKAMDSVNEVVASYQSCSAFVHGPDPNQDSGSYREVVIADRDELLSTRSVILNLPPPPPLPKEEKTIQKIEALCQRMVENGPDIEDKTRQDECQNPEYAFLFGGDPGTEAAISHRYFLWMKKKYDLENRWHDEKSGSQLTPLGVESSGQRHHVNVATECYSAADSDMEMEDDITLSDKDPGSNYATEVLTQQHDQVHKQFSMNEHAHRLQNSTESDPAKDILSSGASCFGSLGASKQHEGPALLSDLEHMKSARSNTKDQNPVKDSIEVAESMLDSVLEKPAAPLGDDLSQHGAADPSEANNPARGPGQHIRSGSPIRLLQDYASDDTSDNEDEACAADGGVLTVSAGAATVVSVDHKESGSYLEKDIGSKSPSSTQKGFNDSEMSPQLVQESKGAHKRSVSRWTADGGKDGLGVTGIDSGSKIGNAEWEDARKTSKVESNILKVDEFGRHPRECPTDSDSDDFCYHQTRRQNKRDRSWSRSRSPVDRRSRRRRRSPRRRKDKRSRSRSWSPRNHRSRSRSPILRRSGDFSGENVKRDKGQCFDFLRGRCYRGASCRYIHHESDKNVSPRRYRSKHDLELSCPKNSRINDGMKNISSKVSVHEHGVTSQDVNLRENVTGQEVEQREEDSVGNAVVSTTFGLNGQSVHNDPIKSESFREVAPEVQETLVVSKEPKTIIHDKESYEKAVNSHQQLLVDGFHPEPLSSGDALKPSRDTYEDVIPSEHGSSVQRIQSNVSVGVSEHSGYLSQLINPSFVSDSLPDKRSMTSASMISSREPLSYMLPSTQLQSSTSSVGLFLSSEQPSLHPEASKELPPHNSSAESPLHTHQLPPPPVLPHPQGENAVQVPQMSREYSAMQHNAFFPFQSTTREKFQPYPAPAMLHTQNSEFSVPPNSSWTSLPTPPSQVIYNSGLNAGVAKSYVSSEFNQSRMHSGTDFVPPISVKPGLLSHPQSSEYQEQAFPPMHEHSRSLVHTEGFSPKPLPQGNLASHSLAGPNHGREDHYKQLSMQDSKFISSMSFGGLHPQPKHFSWESDVNRLRPSSGGKLPPEEHFKTSSHIHSLSQKQQPIYNFQFSASEGNLGVPGETATRPRYPPDVLDSNHSTSLPAFGGSRISAHYNPYASTFEQPLSSKFSSSIFRQEKVIILGNDYGSSGLNHTPVNIEGVCGVASRQIASSPKSARAVGQILLRSGGDQYDPLFDSIEPSSTSLKKFDFDQKQEVTGESNVSLRPKSSYKALDMEEKNKHEEVGVVASTTSQNNDEYGETADAEVGAVENESLSNHLDIANMTTGEVEINQIKSPGKRKKSKDSRSMKLFKISIASFVKEVLKPSWRQGNMSKVAFKTIVKKTVDKVSGAMKGHHLPKSQAKINQYIDSSQRKLTKLVMGYVDKYVKV